MNSHDSIAILTEAFHANKSVNWICVQKAKISALMQYSLLDCKQNGIVIYTEHGIALCKYENCFPKIFSFQQLRNQISFVFNIAGLRRLKPILERENYIHDRHPKTPYLYLMFIGINPDSQSAGKGTKLLAEVCLHAFERDLAVYLETSNPDNLEFYAKNGFDCYHIWESELTGFTTWFFRKTR